MSNFDYSKKEINAMIQEYNDNGIGRAAMVGVLESLRTLKPKLEQLYDEQVFYMSYWRGECGFHGWDVQSDAVKSMETITDGIEECIERAYALVLTGLGERMED